MKIAPWLVVVILAWGLGVRMYDLTDQPLDFHPTRQLRGAIIARGIYYSMLPGVDENLRRLAIQYSQATGQYEPPILESLVAGIYLLAGGEVLWVSRVINSIFWLLGGLAVYGLARRMNSPAAGLVSLGYMLFLPFAIQASRSFQPDPGMTAWIMVCAYFLLRWSEQQNWKWVVAAGLMGGLAILTKPVAAYIVGAAAASIVLYSLGWRKFWRSPQVWCMAGLMLLPTAIYLSTRGGQASSYIENWTLSLSHLLVDPTFYVRWLNFVQDLTGLGVLALSIAGVLLARRSGQALLAGLLGGYLIYGLSLPYQMYTHSYYHIQLVPILGLALGPVAAILDEQITARSRFGGWVWMTVLAGTAIFLTVVAVGEQKRANYSSEPAYWQGIAAAIPSDGKIIALTQDYGYRLEYYGWRKVDLWPTRGERNLASLRGRTKEFDNYFQKQTAEKRYFLVTALGQLNDQPDLKQVLDDKTTLIAQGDGYLLYDLAIPAP